MKATARTTGVKAGDVKGILPLMILMVIIFLLLLFWENELNEDIVTASIEHLHVDYPQNGVPKRMKYSIISEMETFLLLLLGLGLALAGPSESIMEMMKEECVMEETQCATVESGQVKYTVGILMNLTLFDKNTSLRLLKDPMASSLLMFRGLSYSIPKGNILGSDKYYCDGMMTWRKVLEENRSCKLSNDFIHGFMGIIHKVSKASHWKCGQIPAVSYSESPGMQNVICKVTKGKQVPGCQSHSVTSLKKMLTVMTSHSLMSWLVSSSKL